MRMVLLKRGGVEMLVAAKAQRLALTPCLSFEKIPQLYD